jgi:steroid delta-isomerase-like uncharacterized protein
MMSVEENKALVRRSYESINQGFETGSFDDLFGGIAPDDFLDHDPFPGQKPGLAGTKETLARYRASFPDSHVTVEEMVAEGDKVVSRVTMRATHAGYFMGIPPTGKRVSVQGIEIFRIRDGKIAELWGEANLMGLAQHLGAVPSKP